MQRAVWLKPSLSADTVSGVPPSGLESECEVELRDLLPDGEADREEEQRQQQEQSHTHLPRSLHTALNIPAGSRRPPCPFRGSWSNLEKIVDQSKKDSRSARKYDTRISGPIRPLFCCDCWASLRSATVCPSKVSFWVSSLDLTDVEVEEF